MNSWAGMSNDEHDLIKVKPHTRFKLTMTSWPPTADLVVVLESYTALVIRNAVKVKARGNNDSCMRQAGGRWQHDYHKHD